MTEHITVRPANPDDAAAIAEIYNQGIRARIATFETEELFVVDDRCTARWIYRYTGEDGTTHHIRGVDVFRVRDGKVAEKLSYVKG